MGLPERSVAWVAAVVAAVALIFWQTSASMVAVWSASNTYSHGYFILPAFLWLVWGRKDDLARLPIQPSWWALPALALTGLTWLVAHWMSWALPAHVATVAMVPSAMAAVLGIAWVRALAFPLVFLFFAVPFGESLVPVMMDWTADFTVAALRFSGVPVYRDGLHFEIPSGRWSVVDSCSGIRYLFACLAVSSLYAWTMFRRPTKRLLFIGVALVVAIVANWLRAYAIVLLGHLSDNQIAAGADHFVYGGVFFGVIMLIIFAVGALWREDSLPPADAQPAGTQPSHQAAPMASSMAPRVSAVAAALAVMLIWPSVSIGSGQSAAGSTIPPPHIEPRQGWQRTADQSASWRPSLHNPLALGSVSFAKGADRVGVHLALFDRPTPESKIMSSLNRLLEPDGKNQHWKLIIQGKAELATTGQGPRSVRTSVIAGPGQRLLAWQWYWVDGTTTASPISAALLQLTARLRGRSERSAWIGIHTTDSADPALATQVLERFVAEMAPAIVASIGPPPSNATQVSR